MVQESFADVDMFRACHPSALRVSFTFLSSLSEERIASF